MMYPRHSRRCQAGVTLVELLVVITIIAILATLLVVALVPAQDRVWELQVRADLIQLDMAIGAFKQKFQMPPPSFGSGPNGTFMLCSSYAKTPTGVDEDGNPTFFPPFTANSPEIRALRRMFPRINLRDNGLRSPINSVNYPPPLGNVPVLAENPILLDPNQCLVFFLSGGEFTEFTGFSTDPGQPFKAGGSRINGSPYFDFLKQAGRMGDVREILPKLYRQYPYSALTLSSEKRRFDGDYPDPSMPIDHPFNQRFTPRWFLDGWRWDAAGMPYLYISSADYMMTVGNVRVPRQVLITPWGVPWPGLNPQGQHINPAQELWFVPEPAASFSGGATPPLGFVPFKTSNLKFVNDSTWQIVSAGKDNRFGPGSPQLTITPPSFRVFKPEGPSYSLGDAGGDDMTNFHPRKLGIE